MDRFVVISGYGAAQPAVRFIGQFSCEDGGSAGPSRHADRLAPVPFSPTRNRKRKSLGHRNHLKLSAKSWRGDAAAPISATKPHRIKNTAASVKHLILERGRTFSPRCPNYRTYSSELARSKWLVWLSSSSWRSLNLLPKL